MSWAEVRIEIVTASDQDQDDLFVEIQVMRQPWAEVRYDQAKEAYVVTLFPPASGEQSPMFDLVEFRRALMDAKDALVAKGYPDLKV